MIIDSIIKIITIFINVLNIIIISNMMMMMIYPEDLAIAISSVAILGVCHHHRHPCCLAGGNIIRVSLAQSSDRSWSLTPLALARRKLATNHHPVLGFEEKTNICICISDKYLAHHKLATNHHPVLGFEEQIFVFVFQTNILRAANLPPTTIQI